MNTHINNRQVAATARMTGLLVILALVLVSCAPTKSSTPTPSQAASTSSLSLDLASDPTLGQYLVDNNGQTLYILTKDTPNTSSCNAACQQNWPPLVSSGAPKAGRGVDASLISLAAQSNGQKIVTYDQKPLYYKITDKKAGDKTGEDFNNVWFIVSASGQPLMAAPAATPAATPAGTSAPSSSIPTINTASSQALGTFLVDDKGMTLYAFTKDAPDQSNCTAACLAKWTPLRTTGTAITAGEANDSMIGSALLSDGTRMVTYNHIPLYTFSGDSKPGDTKGQGVAGFWFVVAPDGTLIQSAGTPAPSSGSAATPTTMALEPTLMVANDMKLGQILVDGKGLTLYAYANDSPDQSTCSGICLTYWPPLLSLGKPVAGTGVDASKIGTVYLTDGRIIVTYNHMPLYYYSKDTQPGQTSGQGVDGVWSAVSPGGSTISK